MFPPEKSNVKPDYGSLVTSVIDEDEEISYCDNKTLYDLMIEDELMDDCSSNLNVNLSSK